jgi:hypothetical protein
MRILEVSVAGSAGGVRFSGKNENKSENENENDVPPLRPFTPSPRLYRLCLDDICHSTKPEVENNPAFAIIHD